MDSQRIALIAVVVVIVLGAVWYFMGGAGEATVDSAEPAAAETTTGN